MRAIQTFVTAMILLAVPATAQGKRYLEDFDFIVTTVRERGAAIEVRKLDWKAIAADHRDAFANCKSDRDHVVNCMRLLAELSDSHTGVTRSSVPWDDLPGKWEGLYGAGLWFGQDGGRFMLRGVMDGHAGAKELPAGSALVGIGDEPAWFAMDRERRRIVEHAGASSRHSLFASLGNCMLPFGASRSLTIEIITPDGKARSVDVPRWGPGGKSFSLASVQLPDGLSWSKGAVSTMLETPWSKKVGYLRITGSMDDATVRAFDAAFDRLRGMEALVLDCRGMGGGSDEAAWSMVERLVSRPTPNGNQRRLAPRGAWQFDGPMVMLQDELEVSSAETFTWAVCESKRGISIGRTTGGWGIIPNRFKCPSGLLDFRLGVNHRATPVTKTFTEGIGWPADVIVPLGPVFCARPDPERELGLEILHLLHAGVPDQKVRAGFAALTAGDGTAFAKAAKTFAKKAAGFDGDAIARRFRDDLRGTLELEKALLELDQPDWVGADRRFEALEPACKKAKLTKGLKSLTSRLKKNKKELAAQKALLEALDEHGALTGKPLASWLAKHGRTKLGAWMKKRSKP